MEEQQEQLWLLDKSIFWLGIVAFGFLLSVVATLRQRGALCLAIQGETDCAQVVGDVFALRSAASVLYVLALTFFFWVVLRDGGEELTAGEKRSACLNRWASLFVLAAAILRLWDVNEVQCRKNADKE